VCILLDGKILLLWSEYFCQSLKICFQAIYKKQEDWFRCYFEIVTYMTLSYCYFQILYHNFSKVTRKVFWPKKEEVCGKLSILHNEELCDLYRSPSTVRIVAFRQLQWARHVVQMGGEKKVDGNDDDSKIIYEDGKWM